ncbi:MAG: GntR family transcriptional regulator, partial [Sphingomonadaceae bacterium]|nr:GntR family transcriptional regulator [Sphingomonadaceae bacterium]
MVPTNNQDPPSIQIVRCQMARLRCEDGSFLPAGPQLEGKAGLIFDEVERRLATGQYAFGAQIVTADLVKEFAASRAPVTMAMNLLQSAGYVTIRPQVGVWVASPGDEEILDFFRLYARSEGLHTANATRRATSEAISVLELIGGQIEQVEAGGDQSCDRELLALCSLFHSLIRQLAGTPWLCQHSASAWRMSNFLSANRPAGSQPALYAQGNEFRKAIIEKMKAKDGKAA